MIFALEIQVLCLAACPPPCLHIPVLACAPEKKDRRMDFRVLQSCLCSRRCLIVLFIQGRKAEILV